MLSIIVKNILEQTLKTQVFYALSHALLLKNMLEKG